MSGYRHYTFKELYNMLLKKKNKSISWKFEIQKIHFNYVLVTFKSRTHNETESYCYKMALDFLQKYSNKRFYYKSSDSAYVEKFIIKPTEGSGITIVYDF